MLCIRTCIPPHVSILPVRLSQSANPPPPPHTQQASLVVEVEDIDVYKTALQTALESKAGRKGALPASAGNGEPAALPASAAAAEKGACVPALRLCDIVVLFVVFLRASSVIGVFL